MRAYSAQLTLNAATQTPLVQHRNILVVTSVALKYLHIKAVSVACQKLEKMQ